MLAAELELDDVTVWGRHPAAAAMVVERRLVYVLTPERVYPSPR